MKRTKGPIFGFLAALCILAATGGLPGCGNPPNPALDKPGGLAPGDKAYDFSLMDSTGHAVKMSDLQPGWFMVIILYRGTWCSACQAQLAGLKEDYPKFIAAHTTVVAISTDSIEDSADYNQQWRFPYPLLSDPKLEVIGAYGAVLPKGHGGKDIAKPTTIIIGPNKMIFYKYVGHDPTDRPSDDEILDMIHKFQNMDLTKVTIKQINPNGMKTP